ncbi:uncharacterized protein RHOBADRAFT_54611 [Rhodotorula graminis WP1]|uniref:Glutamyl-tRNA(Gln) amidotransferase subunit B, mitochondrial n=1 Tax=Rhodotorula graminis (strain WP1) TaxID=578459 RepID=A0A0P9EP82_RHOGW|nr:uncharacterized protein RHOBADRAFT_54611 [Rhodotorula graminis WP1]KPV74046.1 hypothetical protein RHOBADRAFT_54611 [Rhodotorula graminis WP1]
MPRLRTRLAVQPWLCPPSLSIASLPPRPRPLEHRLASTSARPDSRWPGWIPTIGLELHVQLKGNPKLLSPEHAVYDDSPNTHVAAFDAALPGALPVLQPRAVRLALLACLAFDADINPSSTFDRKHYFYPDLTTGWQVTQRYDPLAKDGVVKVPRPPVKGAKGKGAQADDEYFLVRLEQIQLEQDTAKSFHDPTLSPSGGTLVDLNRAGAALVEIVTRPDMHSPEEAAAFVKTLQAVLRHVGASGANMDKGELRCDVNVSVARVGAEGEDVERGTRCEVKNLNGVRFIASAIESEISRQIALLSSGSPVPQSTRGFDALSSSTFHLRSKENSPDYRYVPDPELGALVLDARELDALRATMPELPEAARGRLRARYGLGKREAGVLVALGEVPDEGEGGRGGAAQLDEASPGLGVRWFETLAEGRDPKLAANWLIHTYLGLLSRASLSLARSPLEPAELGALLDAVALKRVTTTEAKTLLGEYVAAAAAGAGEATAGSFKVKLDELLASRPAPGPSSSSASATPTGDGGDGAAGHDAAFAALIDSLIESHPAEVAKVRAGHAKVLQRLVGAAMKRTKGTADAKRVLDELSRRLSGPS